MSDDRKLSTRLDMQIGPWLLSQEKIQQDEQRAEHDRVLMECVAA